ncbi:MAG: lasso peptide biosynthesis protein, partial [Armatimonadetes bacterium]|nr:lasso peptide biosynthesis protein [Armatimonadota bacterium]
LMALVACVPVTAQRVPSESWMGIYIGQLKIGYAGFFVDKADFEGKPGYRLKSASVVSVPVLGEDVGQNLETTSYLNEKTEPVYEVFKMSSAGYSTTVTARFGKTEITAEVLSDGKKSTKKIPIPPGTKLVADDTNFLSQTIKLQVGDKRSFKSFDPLTLTLDDIEIEVVRSEELVLEDGRHRCLVIKSKTPLGDATSWQDEKGDLLKVETSMGFTMLREPKEAAQSLKAAGEYTPSADLAVMTSAPTNVKIAVPRRVKYLRVRVTGFTDKSLVLSDARQKASYSEAPTPSAVYEITASDFDPAKSASLPIKDPKLDEFLADGPYIQPSDPEIKSAVAQIVGDEKNACKAASLIREWLDANMRTKGNIGIVRTSTDILRARSGVCRDYATLYAALARAAGIPTKVVAGMLYFKDGFYYHAWAESFVGEWVPVDATLSTDFVDATHIKLTEGDALAMFKAVKAVGALKAEILDFK